jgi:hypothetical protein
MLIRVKDYGDFQKILQPHELENELHELKKLKGILVQWKMFLY